MFLYRIFNISSGKQKKLFKGSQGEDGTLIKVRAQKDGHWAREQKDGLLDGEGLVLPTLFQLCVPPLRCRQTPQGSTLPPAVLTRTSPFSTSPQASVWPPCLATQVSVAQYSTPGTLLFLPLVSWTHHICLPLPSSQPTSPCHCWNRSLAGTSGWFIGHILCSSQRLSLA